MLRPLTETSFGQTTIGKTSFNKTTLGKKRHLTKQYLAKRHFTNYSRQIMATKATVGQSRLPDHQKYYQAMLPLLTLAKTSV